MRFYIIFWKFVHTLVNKKQSYIDMFKVVLKLKIFWMNICVNFYFTHAHYTICHLTVIHLITQILLEEEYKLWISSLSRVPATSIFDKWVIVVNCTRQQANMFHTLSKTGLSGKHSYWQQHASTTELHKRTWLLWLAVQIRPSQGNWEVPHNCTTVHFQQNGKLTTSENVYHKYQWWEHGFMKFVPVSHYFLS